MYVTFIYSVRKPPKLFYFSLGKLFSYIKDENEDCCDFGN